MDWEKGQSYTIEARGLDGPQTVMYIGELKLEWEPFKNLHVFRTQDDTLLGLRNEDITSANPAA
jgi:hypothetical protein